MCGEARGHTAGCPSQWMIRWMAQPGEQEKDGMLAKKSGKRRKIYEESKTTVDKPLEGYRVAILQTNGFAEAEQPGSRQAVFGQFREAKGPETSRKRPRKGKE